MDPYQKQEVREVHKESARKTGKREQAECAEDQRKDEENDASNRHMTWWQRAWWIWIDD